MESYKIEIMGKDERYHAARIVSEKWNDLGIENHCQISQIMKQARIAQDLKTVANIYVFNPDKRNVEAICDDLEFTEMFDDINFKPIETYLARREICDLKWEYNNF